MAEGRVFRKTESAWEPVGDSLPTWDHVPPRPNQSINVWVLPKGEGYLPGDVLAFGETGHRMLSLVAHDDVAWQEVIDAALARYPLDDVRQWASQIELWLGMRLEPTWR